MNGGGKKGGDCDLRQFKVGPALVVILAFLAPRPGSLGPGPSAGVLTDTSFWGGGGGVSAVVIRVGSGPGKKCGTVQVGGGGAQNFALFFSTLCEAPAAGRRGERSGSRVGRSGAGASRV